ncbi:putative transposase, partial [Yersinia pestis PY-06]
MKCGHLWATKSSNVGFGMPGSLASNVLLLIFLVVGAKDISPIIGVAVRFQYRLLVYR